MQYSDIVYEVKGPAAWITINRPDKYNAFRGATCEELIHACLIHISEPTRLLSIAYADVC